MNPKFLIRLNATPMAAWLRSMHSALYRVSGGKIGGRTFGCETFLLTTTGAKSGKPRTAPLLYIQDGKQFVIVASNGGSPTHPAWFLNLTKHPEAIVQAGREVTKVRARKANAEEKARLWPRLTWFYEGYEVYQEHTVREIPVVILERS
jgi:deazaflavin-dependent oxidoreductase (nitroreductase family)